MARGGTSAVRFRLAVMMGQPRRSFLLWDTLNTAAIAAMGYLVSWIFYQMELALYGVLYPGYACQISMDKFFAWPVPLAVIPTICVLDLAIGALQVRFGTKAAAVIWIALCLTPAIVGQAVRGAASGRMTLLARLGAVILGIDGALTPGQWALAGAAALASVAGMSIWGYWGAEVRG